MRYDLVAASLQALCYLQHPAMDGRDLCCCMAAFGTICAQSLDQELDSLRHAVDTVSSAKSIPSEQQGGRILYTESLTRSRGPEANAL